MQVEGAASPSKQKQETEQCFWKVSLCNRETRVAEDQGPGHGGASPLFHPCRAVGWEVAQGSQAVGVSRLTSAASPHGPGHLQLRELSCLHPGPSVSYSLSLLASGAHLSILLSLCLAP